MPNFEGFKIGDLQEPGAPKKKAGRGILNKLLIAAGLTAATIGGVEAQEPAREKSRISERAPEFELPSSAEHGLPNTDGIKELRSMFGEKWEELKGAYQSLRVAKIDYDRKKGILYDLNFDKSENVGDINAALSSLQEARQALLNMRDAFYTKGRNIANKDGRVTGDHGKIVNLYLAWQKVVNDRSAASPDYFKWSEVDQWYVSIIRKINNAVAGTVRDGDALAESAMEYVNDRDKEASKEMKYDDKLAERSATTRPKKTESAGSESTRSVARTSGSEATVSVVRKWVPLSKEEEERFLKSEKNIDTKTIYLERKAEYIRSEASKISEKTAAEQNRIKKERQENRGKALRLKKASAAKAKAEADLKKVIERAKATANQAESEKKKKDKDKEK